MKISPWSYSLTHRAFICGFVVLMCLDAVEGLRKNKRLKKVNISPHDNSSKFNTQLPRVCSVFGFAHNALVALIFQSSSQCALPWVSWHFASAAADSSALGVLAVCLRT
jgi:hypothetical protein